jgi:hypothetical protein
VLVAGGGHRVLGRGPLAGVARRAAEERDELLTRGLPAGLLRRLDLRLPGRWPVDLERRQRRVVLRVDLREPPEVGVGDLRVQGEELLDVPPLAGLPCAERATGRRVVERETSDERPEPPDRDRGGAPQGGRQVDRVVPLEVGLELLEVET